MCARTRTHARTHARARARTHTHTQPQGEDDVRRCEANKDFGAEFVQLARSVYRCV